MLYYIILYYIYYIILYYITLHYIILYYIIVYIMLYYIIYIYVDTIYLLSGCPCHKEFKLFLVGFARQFGVKKRGQFRARTQQQQKG